MGSRVVASLAKPDNPDAPLDSPCPMSRLFRPATRSHRHFKEQNQSIFGTIGGTGSRRKPKSSQTGGSSPNALPGDDGQLPELASYTLIAAEIDLESWQSYFINVYRFCRLVTIYSDEYDVALRIARSFDAKARLGASAANIQSIGFFDTLKRAGTAITEVPGHVLRAGTNMVLGRPSGDALAKRSTDERQSTSATTDDLKTSVLISMEEAKPPLAKSATAPASITTAPISPPGSIFPALYDSGSPVEPAKIEETVQDSLYLSNFSIPSVFATLDRAGEASSSSLPQPVETAAPSSPQDERTVWLGNASPGQPVVARVPTVRFSVEASREDVASELASNGPRDSPGDSELPETNLGISPGGLTPNPTSVARSTLAARYPHLPGIQHFDSVASYYRYILSHGLDVVDCSSLEQNVHVVRHSTFTLNRSMIDDLFEIIVSRKRAKDRDSRLVRLDRNRWQFRIAPMWRSAAS